MRRRTDEQKPHEGTSAMSLNDKVAVVTGAASGIGKEIAPAALRSVIATLAPAASNCRAISLPMPLAAPVTTATLSFRLMAEVPSCGFCSSVLRRIDAHGLLRGTD